MNGGLKVLNLFRYHWFDLALILSIALGTALFITQPAGMTLLLWLSLGSLFLHQVEEWRFPGYFPGMVNAVMFKSDMPDRYPLNANSGMLINVVLGWSGYLLAALFWKQAIWLAIATILVSVGNIFAHTIIFNIKGKTFYNPGLLTSWLLFVPIVYFFFRLVISEELASPLNWIIGIGLGIALNYFGIYKMILWLADTNTLYVFPRRFLSP
jgi:ABC-type sugar transport system permease subunit